MNIEEAKTIIEAEKQDSTALAGITSTSKVGVWEQIKYVYAKVAEWIASQWEVYRKELETLVNTRRWATTAWYIEKAKEFQRGDMLAILPNGQFGYSETKTEKRVIKQAAIEVSDRELRFKVATEKDGELARVSDGDMQLFKSYINQIKRPGTPIRFINYSADRITIGLRVFFDGELIEDKLRREITAKVKSYLKDIVFNGIFSVARLIGHVQEIAGVTDCVWLGGESWIATDPRSAAEPIVDRYRAAAGYFKLYKDASGAEHLNLELKREI